MLLKEVYTFRPGNHLVQSQLRNLRPSEGELIRSRAERDDSSLILA